MTYEEWVEIYKPKTNHLVKNDGQLHFETYGIELGYVLATADIEPDRVWTLVDGDEGTYIVNGYHLVNRISYFITEVPYLGDGVEILDQLYASEEEEELEDLIYQTIKCYRHEILASGDWWYGFENHSIHVHCPDDKNPKHLRTKHTINVYKVGENKMDDYTEHWNLAPMTTKEMLAL